MVKLEDKAFGETTKSSFGTAALNLAMIAVAVALGAFWLTMDVGALISSIVGVFIGLLVGYFVVTFIFWIFAKMFGGTGGYMAHYNGLTHIGLWALLSIIPVVGTGLAGLGGLWGIVMNIFYTKKLHSLPTGKAVAAVLIPYAIFIVLAIVVAAMMAAFMVATLGGLGGLSALGKL